MAGMMLVSAGALIDRDGRVLLTSRPAGKDHAGLWEFPGGKVEPGESPEAALVRELEEELMVATETACLAPFSFGTGRTAAGAPMTLLLFVCRKWQGTLAAQEGQQTRWVRPQGLLDLDMPPIDRPIAAQLRDFLGG
jgi:8-oxo-dGTP diphosphatase